MSDLVMRSGRCHGPDCHRQITEFDRSPDFCSEECQTHWHRLWTRGTAVTKGWVRPRQYRGVLTCDPDSPCRPAAPSAVDWVEACIGQGLTPLQAEIVNQSMLQTNRSWSERLTGWWRPNG